MIDLHLHALPGIDDGAADLAEACRMCRLAVEDGCRQLILTPHQRRELWDTRDRGRLEASLEKLRREVGEEPGLHLGAEIAVDSELLSELEDLPASGLVPLAGSRYLLLELDRHGFGLGPDPVELTHELVVAGWRPIFAHPELLHRLGDDLETVARMADAGALFQLTAMSVTGEFGQVAQERSRRFLQAELVHFLASDAHGAVRRPPGLSRARAEVARLAGEELARQLTVDHPRAVLEDRPLALATGVGAGERGAS